MAKKTGGGGDRPGGAGMNGPISSDLPSQKDLEQEIRDYLVKKYGGKVRVVTQSFIPDRKASEEDGRGEGGKQQDGFVFDLKPEELETYLNEYVIRQDRAKAVLATKVCTHFNRVAYLARKGNDRLPVGNIKNNIILIGPTGVGKTYLIKLIAARLGVPFVKGDATKFSETGYVGADVEDLVRDLVKEADGDIERAQYGIIYIDEIDKIAAPYHAHGPDVSRSGVQRALLKPLEETEVGLRIPHDPISQIEAIERYRKSGKREKQTINTRNILFIVSGAFQGLPEIIRRRLCRQGIGFGADLDLGEEREWLRFLKPQDLIDYGLESEFVGRFPVVAVLDELTERDLYEILRSPTCAVVQSKRHDFRSYGIDLRFEDEALMLLARQAAEERTGARSLVSVVEKALLPFEKRLPSTTISSLVVTKKAVEDPDSALAALLSAPGDSSLEHRYEAILAEERRRCRERLGTIGTASWEKAGVDVTEPRLACVCELVLLEDLDPAAACEEVFSRIRQIRAHESSFYHRCGLHISFDDEAVDALLTANLMDTRRLHAQCERICNILEYGLTLARERRAQTEFVIPVDAVRNTELYVNRLIRTCYRPEGKAGTT